MIQLSLFDNDIIYNYLYLKNKRKGEDDIRIFITT